MCLTRLRFKLARNTFSFSPSLSLRIIMPEISEVINERGLDFVNQQQVMMHRQGLSPESKGKKMAFARIAELVRNYRGKPTTEDVVRRVFQRFSTKKGRVHYNYENCGRKPWKLTKPVQTCIITTLLKFRKTMVVTSTSLQKEVAARKGVKISAQAVRKFLAEKGYKWLPRAQKRKYDAKAMRLRTSFVTPYAGMSQNALKKRISCAMDGVVPTTPPVDPVDRRNYCFHDVTHMWRKAGETAVPELSGGDPYAEQVPKSRIVPLWGALSAAGFQEIVYHKDRKMKNDEWLNGALKSGKFLAAVRKLQPGRHAGPRRVICDGEKFLQVKSCKKYYKSKGLQLNVLPAKSPDLNPIESFWGWLRRQMRLKDLEDLRQRRPPLGKLAWKRRLTNFLKTRKAQTVAKAKWANFKTVCKEVKDKEGAASRC